MGITLFFLSFTKASASYHEKLTRNEASVHTRIGYTTNNSVALSPQAKYADGATATCWRNLVPIFADRGVSRGQRGGSPTAVNLSFLDKSRYFSFK
jgi:hypothetical protein